jgi:hypothetical protein
MSDGIVDDDNIQGSAHNGDAHNGDAHSSEAQRDAEATENYADGTWILATFAVPRGIAPAPENVLRALPDPFYDIHPGESIAIVPDISANDEVSISVNNAGVISIAGVDDFPRWDAVTRAAVAATLREMWNVALAGQLLIESAERMVRDAILRCDLAVIIPVDDAVGEITVPLQLMTESEGTTLSEVVESDLELVASLTAYDVAKELVPILAGLRVHHYDEVDLVG